MNSQPSYKYSFPISDSIIIHVSEEYFFPDLTDTIDYIKGQEFYNNVNKVFLDFSNCHSMHGIGIGSEAQQYYLKSKANKIDVYWVGNTEMYNTLKILVDRDFTPEEIIPYLSSTPSFSNYGNQHPHHR